MTIVESTERPALKLMSDYTIFPEKKGALQRKRQWDAIGLGTEGECGTVGGITSLGQALSVLRKLEPQFCR